MGTSLNRVEEEDYSSYTNSSDFISISLEDNNNTTTTATSTSKSSSELHPVCLPPHVTTWQKLNHRLREIFFPDDPLHIFKDQSWRRKLVLAFQYVFPILRWAPHYSLSLFRSDLIAGLTIASLAIPQGISYAKLANLQPIIGLSVIVSLQQLKGLLGITHFTSDMELIPVLESVFNSIKEIGHLPKGVNPTSENKLYFHGPHLQLAIKTGIITGILSLTVSSLTLILKSFLTIVHGSFSRSAVNYNAGAKTIFSNIVMAATVLVTLLFLMPLFHYTPDFVLAAIIITAVVGLVDYKAALRLWKLDKLDFVACCCSFFGVLFISVQIGLAIAISFDSIYSITQITDTFVLKSQVGVSVFKIILHVTRPNTVVLGNIPGTQIFRSLNHYENATRVPSFLILSIESPIFFANSLYLQERISRWVRGEENRIRENNERALKCVILDMTAVTAIDTSGIDAISELKKNMDKRSLQLALVNLVGTVMEKLHQSKTLDSFRSKGLYLTVGEAVDDLSSSWKHWP
ncbi:putative sulfate transporter 3.4 [Citrus sinensis]|nr:putative sulfate transporter 3.4 [Citrus sinensis]